MNDHTSELPPSVQMVQLLAGFQVSQALYAATKLGVPDQLAAGPRTVQELAEMSGAQPSSLGRLLRTLAGLGVLVSAGSESYRLTPLGETLVEGVPGSMRDLALMWMETHYQPFSGLADTLRTGKPAAEAYYGEPFFEWLEGQPEQVHRFSAAMANLTDGIKLGALQSHDFGTPRSIVDVGGADGTLLAHLLRRLPDATGLVYDLPHVVKDAEVKAKAYDVHDRLSFEGGDFFDRVPSGGDLYLMSMILHDWDDQHARTMLSRLAEAAGTGTRLAALELVVPEGDQPHMSKLVDITMLGMLTGRERSETEFAGLLASSGLEMTRISATPTPVSVVEAVVR